MALGDSPGQAVIPATGALTPTVDVRINGSSILTEVWGQVSSVEVEDDLGLPGAFSIEIPEAGARDTPSTWLENSEQFALGASVKILLGVCSQRAVVMEGEITTLEPSFSSGGPSMTLRGYDKRHRLQRGSQTRSFLKNTDSEVVKKIADAAGIKLDSSATASKLRHDYLLQSNQSDLDFLNTRAKAINYELLMIGDKLAFRPSAYGSGATAVVQYGREIREVHFSLSVAMQPTQFSVRGWNVADKKPLLGNAAAGSESSRMGGKSVAASQANNAFGDAAGTVVHRPAATQAEVDARVAALYRQAAMQLLSVECVCAGRHDLRAGIVIEIKGVGPRYGGLYYLHSVKHSYSVKQGYQTHFQGRRNSL
jgi:phage protein D